VQLGYIAQGLLQYLPLGHGEEVWRHFRSWMRTRRTENPPSERVVASALRSSPGEFLANAPENHKLKKILEENRTMPNLQDYPMAV